MPDPVWMKVDLDKLENPPALLRPHDECYFLREYTAHGGYTVSVGNQDVENFKKGRETEGTKQWYYKGEAAKKFARELGSLIGDQECWIAAIPTSKATSDPAYDPRFDMLFEHLKKRCPQVIIATPFRRKKSTKALHAGGDRNMKSIYNSLEWVGFYDVVPEQLIFVDDVLTMGTSYRACKRLILEHHPQMAVPGLFWTRSIWKSEDNTTASDEDE